MAHPDDVVVLVSWELLAVVQHIDAISAYALTAFLVFCEFTHHFQLLGQIHYGDIYLVVVVYALQGPTAGITSHIEQVLWLIAENYVKGLFE